MAHADSAHNQTKALVRELLDDWDTFWVVLDYPHLLLTNNDAERALRHWDQFCGGSERLRSGTDQVDS
ncbi:transposase [Thiohalocapsa sp.]|uniref:IS66 family transposase n=1 Tax=Thiohalocapsa sp. TaxID=2497641 RepID=UPI0025F21A07|nr:transposase [Thiohalocapsa sp.]